MAGFTHTVVETYKTGTGTFASVSNTFNSSTELSIDESVPDATTNYEIDVAVTLANVQSMVLYCDQDVTIKTNDSGTPDDTIALAGGTAIIWNTSRLETNPLTVDLTALYVTNAGDDAARFKATFLLDQSP